MFQAKQSPIIRSSIKLYLQHLVLTNRVWPAVVVDESELKYSLIELLMMGDCFARNMYSDLQELIKYSTRVPSCWNFVWN
jgi:hypothetical protein